MTSEHPEPLPSETFNLARGAQSGDREDLARLYERLAPAIYGWADLRIGPWLRSHVEPQDVVQEVWVRALGGFSDFDPTRTRFRAWVFGIAHNVLKEAVRKHGRNSAAGRATTTMIERQADGATTVSRQIQRSEEVDKFFERVKDLPEPDRSILIYFGLEGLSLPETAERLGISHAAAAKRWQRLRARLVTGTLPEDLLQTLE